MGESAADKLAQIHSSTRRSPHSPECTIGTALSELDDGMREAMLELIADPGEEHTHLARTLTEVWGRKKVDPTTMGRHRRQDCTICRFPIPVAVLPPSRVKR